MFAFKTIGRALLATVINVLESEIVEVDVGTPSWSVMVPVPDVGLTVSVFVAKDVKPVPAPAVEISQLEELIATVLDPSPIDAVPPESVVAPTKLVEPLT